MHASTKETMQAIILENPGPLAQLILKEVARPKPHADELLVKVYASGVNRADLLQKRGHYSPPKDASSILGLEISGEIIALGKNSQTNFKIGDRVCGLLSGGGYAEYALLHKNLTLKIPEHWTYAYAAAIPEALTTVHATVFQLGQLHKNEVFLVHGAGSSIGSFAIQMAKIIGARVITTVGDQTKISKAQALGADEVLDYHDHLFFDALGESKIDVILDFIGADYFNAHIKALKINGRLIQIACMKGANVAFSILPLMMKRLKIQGFVLRSQPLEHKIKIWQEAIMAWEQPLITGALKPILDQQYPMGQVDDAHLRLSHQKHFGKVVLQWR